MRELLICVAVWLVTTEASRAAIIDFVNPNTISYDTVVDFEALIIGNNDYIITTTHAMFGERFDGQDFSENGNYDRLQFGPNGGSSNPLTLLAGPSNRNLALLLSSTTVLAGLGPTGFPNSDAIGTGAVSFVFDANQTEFSFDVVGATGGTLDLFFYHRDGTTIDVVTVQNLSSQTYAFRQSLNLSDRIAGVSFVSRADTGGVAFDNFRFTAGVGFPSDNGGSVVPEPTSLAIWGSVGIAGLVVSRRRKRMPAARA